ncbi:cyclase family protein [Polymorphobacter sp.]|uniref:cyclase family protein n=1 Tax=Polymorphobacter sp. TaxID=1909290 RepID=UPI003F7162AF
MRFLLGVALGVLMAVPASGQGSLERPKWWPSEFGKDDVIGAANRLTPAKVVEAAGLIRTGTVVDLTQTYEEDMPLFALTPYKRTYRLTIPGAPTYGPMGENKLVWNEDHISGELGQNGTQFDSLMHMGTVWRDEDGTSEVRYYNGHKQSEIGDGHGFKKLGVENVPPIFTRGVLIDVATAILPRVLDVGDMIEVADLEMALKKQGLGLDDIREGDAVFVRTGWDLYWKKDNAKFNSGTAGLSPAAGDWLVKKKVVLVGSDNWAVEAIPDKGGRLFAANHQKFLIENGIYVMENMKFSGLIEKKAWVFAFSVGPVPFKGATGSPVRPMAIF